MPATVIEPNPCTTMTSVKSIAFGYTASAELSSLFEDFRLMCNDAVRIAVNEKPKNRFELIKFAYSRLREYGLHTHYILSACEVGYSVYRNKNRKSVPYVRRIGLPKEAMKRNPGSRRTRVILRADGRKLCLAVANDRQAFRT